MYVHQSQLEHLLRPADYTGEQEYRRELERLLLPAWHAVAATAELARDGDFLTFELLGKPVILRNFNGEIRAFVNICAHRHCLLTSAPKGNAPTLRCQYHGWEYNQEGYTGKIPDARCFRPFDRETAHLHRLHCEKRAGLLFVSLADDPPPLADYLGPFASWCDESYTEPFRFIWRWDAEYPANWKVPLENSLEGYHVPCLHRKTFGDHPPEEDTEHILDERFSTLHAQEPRGIARTIQNWLVRRLGRKPRNIYTHSLLHPNLIFIGMDIMRAVQVFVPTSPTTCRHLILLYALRGSRRGPFSYLVYRLLRSILRSVVKQIALEDRSIFPSQQQGLSASQHPGVIGTLEERVYVFQDFVRRTAQAP